MNRLQIVLLVVLFSFVACRNRHKNEAVATVIESDHFSSQKERSATYNISDAESNKSLITTLKPKQPGDAFSNPVTVHLSSGSEQVTCKFSSYDELCVLEHVKELPPRMKVECEKLPCDVYFTNYQAPLLEPKDTQQLEELYKMDPSVNHTILIFKCNDPDVKEYDKEVHIYSNQPYNRKYLNNMVFALFHGNNSKGYVYVDTSDKVQTCTKMLTYKVSDKVANLTKIKDFLDGTTANVYHFTEKPKDTDLRVDISIIGFDREKPFKGTLKVQLWGTADGKESLIQGYSVANPNNQTVLNINTVFKKQAMEKYSNLSLKFTGSGELIMINAQPEFNNVHEVDSDETSYFSLEKGQTLSYKLVKEDQDKGLVEIELSNDNGKIDLNRKTCPAGEQCSVEVTAKDSVQQGSLLFKLTDKVQQKYTPLVGSANSRVREGETLYYTFKVKAGKEAELTVNSENVVVFVGDSKCPTPSQNCSNFTGNAKQPIFIESEKQLELFVAVMSLDDTRFTLRLIENTDDYIDLVDGEPFTYSLKQADKIGFSFRIKQKTDTHFNLIAPLNTLDLYVSNSDKLPTGEQEDLKSSEGNILLKKEDLNGTNFTVLVQKISNETEKVSFTLIASTSKAIVPLEPAISHYDNLQPDTPKIYIINYKRKETNVINFYQFGTATVDVLIDVRLGNSTKDLATETQEDLKIKTTQELLELDAFAEQMCSKDPKEMCEIYLRLENKQKNEIDIVLTHMMQDSIIELKDGMWQSFSLSVTTSSTHFFFTPKHQNKSITVLYNTTFNNLRLGYKLWKNKESHFDPSKWPFPEQEKSLDENGFMSPLRHISISPGPLKECWPDCVILFSLMGIDKSNITNITAWDDSRVNDTFSIMASNDVLELMEHEKIDLILHEKEQKEVYIDLKYFLNKERLTFFTTSTLGTVSLFGCVSSSANPRRPDPQTFDFSFGFVETQIPISKIKSKLEELNMLSDREQYLRILLDPINTTKMSIEFTSQQDSIKQLFYETSQTVSIGKGEQRMFQLVPARDYRIRMIRVKGFPFVDWKECDNKELEKCIDSMTNPVQMSGKTDLIEGKYTPGKLVVIKVQAKQSIEMDVYTQSPYGELQLKEGKTMTDFCDKGETNKYVMLVHREKQTVITINVHEGNPTVKAFTNLQSKPITKTKDSSGIIHIAIPPRKDRNETNPLANLFMNRFTSFGLNSVLETIHVSITDNETNAYYSVSYTTGERGLELEDGLITSTMIAPKQPVTFFYTSEHQDMALVATISFETVEELQNCDIKLSYAGDNKNSAHETPASPEIKKKTPHPTMVFKLPAGYDYYEMLVTNTGSSNSKVSVMVNQDEIIMLPYQIEYPIVLKPSEKQHLMVEVSNEGFLLLVVRKCGEGVPTLSYSFDFNSTLKDEYEFESPIKDEVRQQIFIKPHIGTLYLKFTVDVESVFSVLVQYYSKKADMPRDSAKLGNQGVIDYQLINSIDAEISFVPLNCNGKPCSKVKYEYMSSTSLQNLYSQLVCPSNFFTFTEAMPPLKPNSISVPNGDVNDPVRFQYRLLDQISYFGIRAILENGREYLYKPIEIVTIWGHISRNKRYHSFAITLFLGLVVLCICMLLRRRHRRGYGQLKEEDDPSDHHEATRLRPT